MRVVRYEAENGARRSRRRVATSKEDLLVSAEEPRQQKSRCVDLGGDKARHSQQKCSSEAGTRAKHVVRGEADDGG